MNKRIDKIPLELLAPAGSVEIGRAAIDHGADAVYVGAPHFSARANAGVSLEGIARLIQHAHLYYAKVYVALNTILADEEFPEALDVIHRVYDLGADGLIIQDVGLLENDLPPIPLIASTQMHNDRLDKIRFLEDAGFSRVILARELSLGEIEAIRQGTKIELEFFVHGALCVSYSGQCYMSQAITGRSGNRGVCAQPCRSRYTLIDGEGNAIISDRYLLSLKDLKLIQDLPGLAAAGVTSFKIEGRYKEVDYVKNVTAAYRRALDAFILAHPEYCRSSSGRSEYSFTPDLLKTFNRGYTRYFLSGGREKIASLDTPKSMGEPIGSVLSLGRAFFRTECTDLQNGDGLCFFDGNRMLTGFRVERVESGRIIPSSMKGLAQGTPLYRNRSMAMSRQLLRVSGQRRIAVEIGFFREGEAIHLEAEDEDGNRAEWTQEAPYEEPQNPSMAQELAVRQLKSAGNTPFEITKLDLRNRIGFLPVSLLNNCRRRILEELLKIRNGNYPREIRPRIQNDTPYPDRKLDFHANVFNAHARRFYAQHGSEITEPAFEALSETAGREVMRMRYCLRYQLDACPKVKGSRVLKEPLQIVDGLHGYLLKFDCSECRMSLIFLGKR